MRTSRPTRRIRLVAVLSSVGILLSLVTIGGSAGAQTVESLRDRAEKAANELARLQTQSDELNERYLQTQEDVAELAKQITVNEKAVDEAKAKLDKTRKEASGYMIEAYVGAGTQSKFVVDSADANEAVSQQVLLSLLKNDKMQVVDSIEASRQDLDDRREALEASKEELDRRKADEAKLVAKLDESVTKQQSILNGANSELSAAIRAEQARREAAAAAKARADAEREAARVAEQARSEQAAREQASARAAARNSGSRSHTDSRSENRSSSNASAYVPQAAPVSAPNSRAAAAIAAARTRLGTPYRYGGSTPAGFDCSGLMMWAWAQVGVSLPRTSGGQRAATQRISRDQLQPGDLVFYGSPVHHVGMYVGGGQMIHSPHTGDVVKIAPIRGGSVSYGRIG